MAEATGYGGDYRRTLAANRPRQFYLATSNSEYNGRMVVALMNEALTLVRLSEDNARP